MLLKDGKINEHCHKLGNKGSVNGAIDTMRPLQLTNRFQPLLQIPIDDVCVSQPMLTDQTKTTLVGKKNGSLDRGSDNVSNIIPTQKQPPSNGPSKNFEVKKIPLIQQFCFKSQTNSWWNKKLLSIRIATVQPRIVSACTRQLIMILKLET